MLRIGKTISVCLWKDGAKVIALSNQRDKQAEMKNQYPGMEFVYVDLIDWDKCRPIIEKLDPVYGLVNCAGVATNEELLDPRFNSDVFDNTIAVNTKALLFVSQVIAKKMVANNIKGSIVNISSIAAEKAIRGYTVYAGSKGAVCAMTRVMALELAPYGIRATCVRPTAVDTNLSRTANTEEQNRMILKCIPLNRFATTQDIADTVLFLLSDKASMISGSSIVVDGGHTLQ